MQKRSSQFKTQLLQLERKEGSSSTWNSYFHYFIFMFYLPSCSKPLQKLSQLPIGLPAQSVRTLCPRQVFFLAFLSPPLKNPRCICKLSTVSAQSRRSYGKIEDYEEFIGIRLHLAPDAWLPPSFPYPSPPRTQGPVQTESALAKTSEGGHNTAEKMLGEVCGWILSLKTAQTRKKTKRRTFGITMVSILQVRRFLILSEVFVRGLRTRCLYSVWKNFPSLSCLHELVSKRPKNVKLC